MSERNGILNLYKPSGITSHDAVNIVRKVYSTKKVGHTGTLDPMASGVLPILVGNAVKASEYIMMGDKHYIAGMKFGISTDTDDITGEMISESNIRPSADELKKVLLSFIGKSMQKPPIYSAIKKDGKKLYELARAGIEIETEARSIEIYSLSLISYDENEAVIDVKCSKGTYIRSLVRDIAEACSSKAAMSSLERLETHGFTKENSISIEALKQADNETLTELLYPVEYIFPDSEKVYLNEFYSRLAKNGAQIYLDRARIKLTDKSKKVLMYDDDKVFFALGEVRDFDGSDAVKPVKMFL